jgi:heme-degrading monooxygenase HmoA
MHSRHVTWNLKPIKREEFTQMYNREVLPLLQKQNGFNDAIALVDEDGKQVVAISLWESKESADTYSRETYPQVLKSLGKVIDGTPQIRNYEVAVSTFHRTPATV